MAGIKARFIAVADFMLQLAAPPHTRIGSGHTPTVWSSVQ
jgi:hypothetical protein